MNYDDMTNDELNRHISSTNASIEYYEEQIKRINLIVEGMSSDVRHMQTVVDTREINEIADADFIDQVNYFLNEANNTARSFTFAQKKIRFFDALRVRTYSNSKQIEIYEFDKDFIKNNYDVIKEYLPLVLDFAETSYIMETTPIKHIRVRNNQMVEHLTYYPSNGSFRTEGVYLRGFNNIDELLNHMMET